MPASLQQVPVSVASDQLTVAINAEIEGAAVAVGGGEGTSVALVVLFVVMLSLLMGLAWLLRRQRSTYSAGDAAVTAPGASRGSGLPEGQSTSVTRPQPQETLALPPHVLALLAKRDDRREESVREPPSVGGHDAPDEPATPLDQLPGSRTRLDILIGR